MTKKKIPTAEELLSENKDLRIQLQESNRIRQQLEKENLYDPLTGLPCWSLFEFRFQQTLNFSLRYERFAAILLLDLSRFKKINDTFGQKVGNETLVGVGERLKENIRGIDTVCRIGGDEFAVLIENLTEEDHVIQICQHILEKLQEPFIIEGNTIRTTSHFGISYSPKNGTSLSDLINKARRAANKAKELGKNNFVVYDDSLDINSSYEANIESLLHTALEKGELSLNYQPLLDLKTQKIAGMEALIRWHSPELGFVPPISFIPIAEETGLILDIGEWIFKEACTFTKKLVDDGHKDIHVAVNLSVIQFRSKNLVNVVKNVLKKTGLPGKNLHVEVTEGISIQNTEKILGIMREFKKLGISISIDDFGTGYSSLSYLKKFPIDTLKIDRSFVMDITKDNDDLAITQAIIAIAKSLNLTTVAEGIETDNQKEIIKNSGCDIMQGYLFSKPLPGEEFIEFINSKS